MTDTAIERDEQVAEALVAGQSVRVVQKQFGLTTAELDAALDRLWPIDTAARVRVIKRDVGRLDKLTEVFYLKALAGDVQSGLLTVRIWERLHELLGLNAAQRVDLQIVSQPAEAPNSFEKLHEMIMRIGRGGRNGDGAVDVLSNSGDEEPSHWYCRINGDRARPALGKALIAYLSSSQANFLSNIRSLPQLLLLAPSLFWDHLGASHRAPWDSILCSLPLLVIH